MVAIAPEIASPKKSTNVRSPKPDPLILRLADDRFWVSLADSDVLLWARGVALGLGLDVHIEEPDVSPLALQGPRADAVAARLFGEWIHELKFFRFREVELDGGDEGSLDATVLAQGGHGEDRIYRFWGQKHPPARRPRPVSARK